MIFDQEYTKLCSEKTLQSNKEGFFLQFVQVVEKNVGEKWVKNVFGKLKTDQERIRKIYHDDKISGYVVQFLANVQEIYRKKCGQTCKQKYSEAEEVLKKGDKKKALILYSQSILKAPKSAETLSLALLARAKTLISLNDFSNALTDLQLALKEKLSNTYKFEAFSMMSMCYKAQNEEKKAQIALNLAEKLIGGNIETYNNIQKFEPIRREIKTLPPINERHVQLKNASKKLTVKKSKEVGRYIVASEEIKIGETLVVEEPVVACLFPEKFGTHCHHCFDRFVSPIGCPDCTSVSFCTPKCRDEAIQTYHKYECKYLDLLIGSGMSVLSLTALRAITQKNVINNDSLENLCTNSSKRTPHDFLQRTLMAAFLLRCLQKSGYFGDKTSVVPTTEVEYKIGEKLLLYLKILQFNAHEIGETLYTTDHRIKVGRPAYIGVGVYPTVALFNHDCYPSVTRYFIGRNIVVKSMRLLSPNSEICENYGPIFTHRKLLDRQRFLSSRYWFNCQCSACFEDWPLSGFITRIRCPTIGCGYLLPVEPTVTECVKCHQKIDLENNIKKLKWCEQQYQIGSKFIEDNEVVKAIDVLSEALEVFHRVSAPPHRETHLAEEALRLCFADFGNTCDCLVPKNQ